MQKISCWKSNVTYVIMKMFCTHHNSNAVVMCAKFFHDHTIIFHNTLLKIFMKFDAVCKFSETCLKSIMRLSIIYCLQQCPWVSSFDWQMLHHPQGVSPHLHYWLSPGWTHGVIDLFILSPQTCRLTLYIVNCFRKTNGGFFCTNAQWYEKGSHGISYLVYIVSVMAMGS